MDIKRGITGKEGWRAQLIKAELVKLGNNIKCVRRKQRGKTGDKIKGIESKEERGSRRKD